MAENIRKLGLEIDAKKSGRGFEQTERAAEQLERQVEQLGQELQQAGRRGAAAMDDVDDGFREAMEAANRTERSYQGIQARAVAVGSLLAEGLEEAAQAAIQFSKDSTQAFFDFDRGAREAFTIIPQASGEMRESLKKDLQSLNVDLGRLPEETLPAVYQALSAGIPEDNVLAAVETASDAARAGVADLTSTMKLGASVLNAQVGGVESLQDVYDQLFFIVKRGVTTFPELNEHMSQVTSLGGEVGASMQDIAAAMITMTRQGDTTEEAAELLSLAFQQLATAGSTLSNVFEEATGKSFRRFLAEGGTLAEGLQSLERHANATGQELANMLGGESPFYRDAQAARAVLELTGKHMDTLVGFTAEATDQLGAMQEAATEMGESAEQPVLEARAAYEGLKIAIGKTIVEWNLFQRTVSGTKAISQFLSGDFEHRLEKQGDELLENAAATTEWGEALAKLNKAYEQGGPESLQDVLSVDAKTAVRELATISSGLDDFIEKIEAAGGYSLGDGIFSIAGVNFMPEEILEQVKNVNLYQESLEELARTGRDASDSQQAFHDAATNYGVGLEALNRAAREANHAQSDLVITEERLAEQNRINATLAQERASRERELARAADEQARAFGRAVLGAEGHVAAVQDGQAEEQNWIKALADSAIGAGANTYQTRLLLQARGDLSEETINAMLAEAAMAEAARGLGKAIAEGNITVQEGIDRLTEFQNQLRNPTTANLDYKDFEEAEKQAEETRAALLGAEGNYEATFTTTYRTVGGPPENVHRDEDAGQSGGGPGGLPEEASVGGIRDIPVGSVIGSSSGSGETTITISVENYFGDQDLTADEVIQIASGRNEIEQALERAGII